MAFHPAVKKGSTPSPGEQALRAAAAAGVAVLLDGNELVMRAGREPPADVVRLIVEHKPEVIRVLTGESRITLDEAAADLAVMHREIARDWPAGAFAIFDDDLDLRRRFADAEQALDNLAQSPGGPPRRDWTAAVAGFAAVLREIAERYRARHETAHEGKKWQT